MVPSLISTGTMTSFVYVCVRGFCLYTNKYVYYVGNVINVSGCLCIAIMCMCSSGKASVYGPYKRNSPVPGQNGDKLKRQRQNGDSQNGDT